MYQPGLVEKLTELLAKKAKFSPMPSQKHTYLGGISTLLDLNFIINILSCIVLHVLGVFKWVHPGMSGA